MGRTSRVGGPATAVARVEVKDSAVSGDFGDALKSPLGVALDFGGHLLFDPVTFRSRVRQKLGFRLPFAG